MNTIPVVDSTLGSEAPRMLETTPAKVATDPDSKFTRNTKVWWQDKTGWSDDEYAYRRNAVYNKIRERWPEEKTLNGRDGNGAAVKQEIRDWLRPLVISFNDHNWPAGATRDRIERQLQPYVSWALYLNRHPPTLGMPTTATLNHVANMAGTVVSTPSLPSYSFVTPSQVTPSTSTSRAPTNANQPDYWSETSSDEETFPSRIQQPRKSQSIVTQSPTITNQFDWDDVEVVIDVRSLNQDHIWIPMYDLKPAPKHSQAHWADFRMIDLYNKISAELNVNIGQDVYQFTYLNQPGNFVFRREGAYHIALKRFSQTGPVDQVLRLRLEKISAFRSPAPSSSRGISGQHLSLQTPSHSPALAKRPSELSQQRARPVITSDVQPRNGQRASLEHSERRPRKRLKLPAQHSHEPASREATDSDTPPAGNHFTAVNSPHVVENTIDAPPTTAEPNGVNEQAPELSEARTVIFSEPEASDQEMTQPEDHDRTQSDTIALIKMESAG